MKQSGLGLGMTGKRTRRRQFLEEMERVVPWAERVALVSPYLPEGKRGCPPFNGIRLRFRRGTKRIGSVAKI